MNASWSLTDLQQARPRSQGTVICRTGSIGSLALVENADQVATDTGRTLTGTAAVFSEWQEVHDLEGHYLERIAPSAFAKTISENGGRIPLLLDHGRHPQLGTLVLGELQSLNTDASGLHYVARLHDGLPELLVSGLRSGGYGSSFRARPVKSSYDPRPERSDFNPDRLPQVTRTELMLLDLGPTSIPAYAGTEARLRSLAGAYEPTRHETANRSASPEPLPAWQLQREDGEREPYWLLRRKEERRRGRTICKA